MRNLEFVGSSREDLRMFPVREMETIRTRLARAQEIDAERQARQKGEA